MYIPIVLVMIDGARVLYNHLTIFISDLGLTLIAKCWLLFEWLIR